MQISSGADLFGAADLLAVAIPQPTEGDFALPAALEARLGGPLRALAEADKFKLKAGTTLSVPTLGALPAQRLLLVGAGDGGPDALRIAAGMAAHHAREKGAATLIFAADPSGAALGAAAASAVAEGLVAGNYRFDRYKPESDRKAPLESAALAGDADTGGLARGQIHARAQRLARDLVNEQADIVNPEHLAAAAAELASEHLTVRVYDEDWIIEAGMGGVHGVGRGSSNPPRFVHMTWDPPGETKAHVAIVGKGVTFDAGGLDIKTAAGMQTMRCDMAGAAAVVGAMSALAELAPAVKVEGVFAAAENMLGPNAFKQGDMLIARNGKAIEIHHTDAEGRLLLADCLSYVSEIGVDACVDLATLTGSAVMALGEHYTALMSDDDDLVAALQRAGADAGEGLWRMPLEPLYRKKIKAEWGHIKNVGGRQAGAITAGLFLKEFVDGPAWAHMDIAGPSFLSEPEHYLVVGGTGAGARTLLRWIEALGEG